MKINRYSAAFLLPALLLISAVAFLFPYCQYYIDPDAVAYLSVSRRYANGDIAHAINGYWSPLSCWLTAWLMKLGLADFKAAIVVNAMAAVGFLCVAHILFRKFIQQHYLLTLLNGTFAIVMAYAVYRQSFADLWGCFLLSGLLLVLLRDDFIQKPLWWIIAGLLSAAAYYAKAYALPFALLNIACSSAWLVYRGQSQFNFRKWLFINGIIVAVIVTCCMPWFIALHHQYGIWTTGTAGTLNLSWYLVGHPYYRSDIHVLLPPVYPDAVYYWEDPYRANGPAPHFWNSPGLLLLQIVRVGYNLLKMVSSMNELSAFFLPLYLLGVIYLLNKNTRQLFAGKFFLVCLSFVLFPIGYLLINFEARYLWYMLPVALLGGTLCIARYQSALSVRVYRLLLLGFYASFIAFPAWDMKSLVHAGKTEHDAGHSLKAHGVQGTFTTNIAYGKEMQNVVRLAYFSGNSFYYMPLEPDSHQQLLAELRRYHIKYYIHFQPVFDSDVDFKDESGHSFPVVYTDTIHMPMRVFLVNQ